jgi:hypothetical protein
MSINLRLKYLNKVMDTNDMLLIEIYVITNLSNMKKYVGQAVSHRLNTGKYRPFGSIKRLNDHISEATCNTKKKQCTALNNAIRKYGKESFKVEVIDRCLPEMANDLEIRYIKEYNTISPNGYNLTNGGKCGCILIEQRVKAMENTYKQYEDKKLNKFKDVRHLININDLESHIREYTSYGKIYYKIFVGSVTCIFFGQHLSSKEELKQKAIDFLITLSNQHFATKPNCGNPLESSATTSNEKLLEGSRVMTGSEGNNAEDRTIRSQAPKKFKAKLKSKA